MRPGVYILAISPPPGRGGKKRYLLEFGEENRPLEKIFFRIKIFLIFIKNLFSKSNSFNFNFIIREEQFSFGKDSAQTTKA
jgi:hypothetical protein